MAHTNISRPLKASETPLTPEELADACFYQIISTLFEAWIDTCPQDFSMEYDLCRDFDTAIRESCGYDAFLDRLYDYMCFVLEPARRFNGHRVEATNMIKIITILTDNGSDKDCPVTITLGMVEVR